MKKITVLIAVIVIAAVVFATVSRLSEKQKLPSRAAEEGVTLSTAADKKNPVVGESVTIDIMLSTANLSVTAVDFFTITDPDLLEFKEVKTYDTLPIRLPLPAEERLNPGEIHLILGNQPTTPQKGNDIKIASLTYQVLKSDPVCISFGDNSRIAATGQTGNVFKSGQGICLNSTEAGPTTIHFPIPTTSTTPPPITNCRDADLKKDLAFNTLDVAIVINGINNKDLAADINHDGAVNSLDLSLSIDCIGRE